MRQFLLFDRHVLSILLYVSPAISITAGIAIGAIWKYHWFGLACGLNLAALIIPSLVKGYGSLFAIFLCCSLIGSAVTKSGKSGGLGFAQSGLIGAVSSQWFLLPYVAWFLLDPQGSPSRSIPWAPLAIFLGSGAFSALVTCVIQALFGLKSNKHDLTNPHSPRIRDQNSHA